MVVLACKHLSKYLDDRPLWADINLSLASQQQLALKGPSGSGKTVLLRVLAGLEPSSEGEVSFLGKPLSDYSMPRYRAQVMYLHQRAAVYEGTVAANLRRPFSLRVHKSRPYDKSRILGHLASLGRGASFLEQDAFKLSGGERQLVALVRALALEPTILLLDEATASLDPEAVLRTEALVSSWLHAEAKRACIWTSHDATQLTRVSSDVFDLGTYNQRGHS